MAVLVLFSVSFVAFLVSSFLVFRLSKGFFGVFNLFNIFIALSIVDVFIPGVLWSALGFPKMPPWKLCLEVADYVIGILYYISFYFIMLFVSILVFPLRNFKERNLEPFVSNNAVFRRKLYLLLLFTFVATVFSQLYKINQHGGFGEWFYAMSQARFEGAGAKVPSVWGEILTKIPWRTVFNSVVLLGFYCRFLHGKRVLYGIVFPFFAIVMSLFTFFRGSVLLLIIGLMCVEYMRLKFDADGHSMSIPVRAGRSKNHTRFYVLGASAVLAFVFYGYVRQIGSDAVLNKTPKYTESAVYQVLTQGSGLDSVSRIVGRYGEDVPFLLGKTYFDMLLLPVPRSIYASKPQWYGIDDITRGMGWPESTQSAVTLPGEAYANFGWFGLLVAIIYGLGFGGILKMVKRRGGILFIIYPSMVIPLAFVANWMAFSGIMNLFFPTMFVYFFLKIPFVSIK